MSKTGSCIDSLNITYVLPRDESRLYQMASRLGQHVHEVDTASKVDRGMHELHIRGRCTAVFDDQGRCAIGRCLRARLIQAGLKEVTPCPRLSS